MKPEGPTGTSQRRRPWSQAPWWRARAISESPARLFVDAFSLRVSAVAMAVIMVLSPTLTFAQSVPAGSINITPDGRTATTVTTSGSVGTVTTNTISGPNAFNSFSQFQIGRGAIGNLMLPPGTSNLINLINGNDPAVINGVMNSYKNGQIGGNVYFAAPGGFVVGRSGVVNVGSLSVSTPTREFVDGVVSRSGQINQSAVDSLMAGTVPLSPDGNIRIRGRINAIDSVRLTGQNVAVGPRDAANRQHAARFASTVNSRGLQSGGKIVVRNGSIQIVAANDARINGRLSAKGGTVGIKAGRDVAIGNRANVTVASRSGQGGAIAVNAGRDIKVAGHGVFSAKSGAGDGGTVRLIAGRTLTVDPGASFDASSAQGNGGLVELSSYGTFNFARGLRVNVGAANGQAGTLLIDPPTIVVGAAGGAGVTMTNTDIETLVSALSAGGTLLLCAGSGANVCNGSFTLADGGVIDTRISAGSANSANVEIKAAEITINGVIETRAYTGARVDGLLTANGKVSNANSGSVLLSAIETPNGTATITIGSTGKIYADANNGRTGGAVVMNASVIDHQAQLPSAAIARISIAGTVTGASIAATSTADASTYFANSSFGMAQFTAGALGGILAGMNGGFVKSEAEAKVTVEGTANLTASGAITLSSIGSEQAETPAITFSLGALQNSVAASVVVGIVNADIATQVKSGATISGGNLSVLATNDAKLAVKALVFTATTAYDGSFAYSTGTVNTKALVDPGAVIDKAGNITVAAHNTNSFSTSATSFAGGTGTAAVAVAISDVSNNALANFGASLPSAANAGTLTVYSGNHTRSNAVYASSTVGSTFVVTGIISALGMLSTSVGSLFLPGGPFDATGAGSAAAAQGTTAGMRAGITVAINTSTLTSSASIAAIAADSSGDMVASGDAPTIVTSGGVGVISDLLNAGIRGDADASINSSVVGTVANPTTGSAVSMAVNVTQLTQSSTAYIGSGVSIRAPKIGVRADAASPITISWLDFDSFYDVTRYISGNFGVAGSILTTYANAVAESASTGISGAVNYFQLDTNTTAWVGSGATLIQTGAATCSQSGTSCWTSNLSALGANAPDSVAWARDIMVLASTETSSINVGGNFSWLKIFGTNSTDPLATSIGGSANVNIFNTNTVAGIGAYATVTTLSSGTLEVGATTRDLIYAVSPTSGKGAGLGLNGVAAVLQVDNHTSASISHLARVTATTVNVHAEQRMSSFNVAGGVGYSASTGFGIVVALASMSIRTMAFIGDNSSELSNAGATGIHSNLTRTVTAEIDAFNLNVTALTVGRLTTVAVAAQGNNNTPNPADAPAILNMQPSNASYLAKAVAFFANQVSGLEDKISALGDSVSGPVQGGNSVAGAGSASVDIVSVVTAASIANATVRYAPGGNNNVTVQALNNTIIDTASGAAALSKGAPGTEYTVGIAGAVAVTLSSNMTTAIITQSNVTAHDVTVQALAAGESTTLGLAVALTAGSGDGVQVSASMSLAEIKDGVQANVDSSTVGQAAGGSGNPGDLTIIALQKTNIGIGAGSLYLGFGSGSNNGFGVSMTYASIGDPSSGAAVSAVLSNSYVYNTRSLTVEALNVSRIVSGAATAGGGESSVGFSGAVIVNDISPTILAEITSVPAVQGTATVAGGVTVIGDVIVLASGGSVAALDALIDNAALAANGGLAVSSDAGVDFSGNDLSPSSATGAAIFAVAGNVQFGSSNVGVSIVVNRIGTRHQALIDRASVTSTGGVVSVSANDNAEIMGIAVGGGVARGAMAGNGSVVYNAINNAVVAQIGHGINATDAADAATATVDAAAVSVTAQASGSIRGAAGAISINISGGNAVGLSAVVGQIGTYVSAAILGATVTADNALTSNSALINDRLQAGSVVVAGQADANILGIAIGVAMSIGASQQANTPQQNLATLVAGLAPAAASSLVGFGGGGITPPSQRPPPTPPAQPSTGLSGAGSLVLSTESTSVYSTIADGGNSRGASVTADNNVLVLAANADNISAYSGALSVSANSGKGIGASVVVNMIDGTTSASIANSTVDARATGSAATIDSGTLANAIDPTYAYLPATTPSLANGTTTIKGIAVVATSAQSADTVAAVLSVASHDTAISANAITNVMGGTTEAKVGSSDLNTNLTAGQVSAVRVTASSASYSNNLDLGMSISGQGPAGTAALVINIMDRTTNAEVDSTDIGSVAVPAGLVSVIANAFQGTAAEVIGVAVSGNGGGIAGSALTNLFESATKATLNHGTVHANSLAVQANSRNGFFGAVGAAAFGNSVGAGATVVVTMSTNTVTARVGDRNANTAATTLHLSGPLSINASNETDTSSYAVVGAIGGSAAISAQFSGMFITNNVSAELNNTTTTITGSAANGTVTVSAQEIDSIAPVVGGLAAGGTGSFGAAVNLVVLKSNTAAQIAGGSVTTPGAVDVSAVSTRHVNPITVTGSLAGQVALAATVGVVLIGSGASADQMSVLKAGATSGDSSSGTLGNAGAVSGTNVVDQVEGGIDGISAQILTADVTASAINVSATAQTAVKNIAGALAIGTGAAGIGAGIGFTDVDQRVTASTSGGTLTAPTIAILATARDHGGGRTAETLGAAGAGGLYVGLGAAVADSRVNNTVLAQLGSRTLSGGINTGTITVRATDSSSVASYGYGFALGIAAVGISLGNAEKSSAITASIAASTTVSDFSGVMVIAVGGGSLTAETIAGAAGIASGAGAESTATDEQVVVAQIGANASISAVGAGVLVSATAVPDVFASSIGVAAGAVGIGASLATANAAVRVTAGVDDNTTIAGGNLTITAMALLSSSGHSARAFAVGSGGGLLLGIQATLVRAANTSIVTAYGGKNLTLPSANVTIAAQTETDQLAEATGIAVGYVGAGATVSQTSSSTATRAYLDEGAVTATTNTGVLSITATGHDSNSSAALAGSGGVTAGAAATATTSTTSTTEATLKGGATSNTLYVGGLGINAQHTATYAARGDAYQASAMGASGGIALNTVLSNVTAAIGPRLIVHSAAGNMNVIAASAVNQTSGGARAGSGGVAAGAATTSDTTVTQNVAANIGASTILSLNDNPATATGQINIEAYNLLDTVDSVTLTAGGLFAGGGAHSNMSATANNSVDIADGAHLFSAGNIAIGTAARMTARNNASANLYGLITGAGATTNSVQNAHQTVTVGDATIEAWGLINIYAGQSGDGAYTTNISSNGTTVVYNYALIPISAQYSGRAVANSYATLTLETGSRILGANNVFIGASPGATAANGSGTNYNPYLEIFSTANYDNRSVEPVRTGDVVINGIVAAGIHNRQIITITYGGVVTLSSGGSPYGLTLRQVANTGEFNPVMRYDRQEIQYAVLGAFNPRQDVLEQIASLSGLTTVQVNAAVAAGQTINALNDDADGTKQRQINTYIQQLPYMSDQNGAAFAFGDILASAGNVSILANTLSGTIVNGVTPSVSARDSALISFDNQGTKFLFTSALALSGVSGGRIHFTGAATDGSVVQSATQGIAFSRDLSAQTPTILVNASYNATNANLQPIDQNGNLLATTPDIYFGGVITNVNGLLSVTSQLGNVLITRDIRAGTVAMTVPNGLIGGNLGANSVYNSNFDVASQWSSVQYRPTDVLTAVYAAATYLGIHGSGEGGIGIGGSWELHPYEYYTNQVGYQGIYSPVANIADVNTRNAVFTARMLATFYDGAHNNSPSLYSWIFLPTGEGITPAAGGTASSWVRWNYENQAYANVNNNGGPFNYANGGNFFQVIQIQNQVVNGVQAASVAGATSSTITAGKALILSASAININGNIVVGQSSNYSVDIGANATNRIQAIKADVDALAQARSAAAAGNFVDLTGYVSAINGSDVMVKAFYNALTDQIVLNPVVQGTGGYVYLNGRILSASTTGNPMGNITVRGGAGTVTVNNTTGTALVTNVINTGVSAASVVQFVDQAKNLTTWYVYNAGAPAGQQVSIYQQAGVNNGGYAALNPVSVTANANLTYQPADLLYRWVDTASLSRPATSNMSEFGWTFDNIVSANSPVYPYARSSPTVIAGTQAHNFQETITATGSYTGYQVSTGSGRCCGTDFHGTWFQARFDHLTLTMTNTVRANFAIGINFTGGGTSNINVTSNASIIVNASINNLQGNTAITTTGANSAIIAGAEAFVSGVSVSLHGQGGVGSLARPIPVATYGGTLSATSVDRDIAVAAAGGLRIAQVKANPAVAGQASQGNVRITATGDITSATPYNVSNPIVVGKSITINTSGGAIGAVSSVDGNGLAVLTNINPIVIQASATLLSNGTYDGGLLNSESSTGTYIVQSSGDLRIGEVSSNGPVFLAAAAANGQAASILNGLSTGGLTTQQSAYLAEVWNQLELLGTGSGVPGSVVAYQSMIKGAYNDYWQLRNIAFADGETYAITDLGAQMIAAQLAAKRNVAVSAITADEIRDEATFRYLRAEYLLGLTVAKIAADLNIAVEAVTQVQIAAAITARLPAEDPDAPPQNPLDRLFGTSSGQTGAFTWAVQTAPLTAALTTYDSAFDYALPQDSALYAKLSSGSQWTLNQLTYTVSASANPENNIPPPSISSLAPNVSGRQVMLYASNGNIGSLAAPETFTFRSDDASNLTAVQKALLASAGPGQLTVTTTDVPGTNGQIKEYTVSVAQQSLLIVSPLGPVSAKAQAQIYLGSAEDLLLGGIPLSVYGPMTAAYSAGVQTTQPGEVRLQAVGSILGGVAGEVAISGNIASLTLIAETGSIGRAAASGNPANNPNALLLALTGATTGVLNQAQAVQGIYLRQTAGDLIVGNINAGSGAAGVLHLAATGSIYALPQFTDRSIVHLVASALDLRAGGSVSFNQAVFQPLQVRITGAITGHAAGAMTILSPNSHMIIGAAGDFGTLSAGGALTLDSAGDLTLNASVTAGGTLSLLANGAIVFTAGTAGAPLAAASTAAGVTVIAATLSMGAFSDIDAAGTILVATTGNATLGRLTSALAFATAGTAITVSAGGPLTVGAIINNADGRDNLRTLGANAAVLLTASGDIGTAAARLRLDTPTAEIRSTGGNVYLATARALHVTSGVADLGAFDLVGGAGLQLDTLTTGTQFTILSTAGAVGIGTATSGGSQTVNAAQNVTFNQLTTTGIAGDAGDVLVTAGSIQGGSIAPAGLARLTATAGITGTGSIVTTELIALTAGGDIDWATLDGKTVTVESTGGSATVGNATSRGTLRLLARQNAGFTQLTTTGLAGDPSDVIVTTAEGAILGGSITTHRQVILSAGADLPVNSPLAANARIVSTGSITSPTLIVLTARGQIDWETLNAITTIDVTSTDGGARVGTATAGGSITILGKQDVAFDQLTNTGAASDVTLTSDNGAILGGSITSDGAVSLIAAGSITATGANGSGGALNWSMLRSGGSMFLRSLGDAITIDDAISGGSMTLWARYNVTFRQLTAAGAGSGITLRSDEGAIIALGTGLVNVDAGGSVTMAAATSITGNEVRAGGSVAMTATGGRIGWNAVIAGTSVDVRSSADVIDIATITSGGTQNLWAENNVTFTQLTATAGGADITSNAGAIVGGAVSLAGATRMAAKTTISGTTATSTAGAMDMSAEEMITWNAVDAAGGSLTITSSRETIDIPSLASGGKMTLDVAGDMLITQITTTGIPNDAGDVEVTSHTGRIAGGTIAANGGITLDAPVSITGVSATGATGAVVMNTDGLIDWATLNAGTSINMRSTADAVNLGTATSGGSQTIRSAGNTTFNTLTTTGITGDVGDVTVTSDTAAIVGGTVAANGSATLTAATSSTGTAITTATGAVDLVGAGLIDWATLNAGTTIDVVSTTGVVTLGTATSGGSQTIRAAQNATFGTLTTSGITGDVGDVTVTSDTAAIQGTTVAANGSATLTAATTNTGTSVTATTGSVTLLAGGLIDWATLDAGTTINVRSTAYAVNIGTATSGGSQTIRSAGNTTFGTLTTTGITGDVGDVTVTSDTAA
ncbi:MAG: leukotoxin LktA family filamentous adhesin, partial [Bradyrhizobium sp.]|nr:leukotoxin LktA family filamentous adhesin [Bradyrhizobium sp.]